MNKIIKPGETNFQSQFLDYQLVATLGLAHGVSDCVAGYLIGKLSQSPQVAQIGFLIALYNLLAFAGQMPAGLLLDKFKQYRLSTILALLLTSLGLVIYSFSITYAIILIGLGSAFFHVSGGALTYLLLKNPNGKAGIFAGPGVIGLILGGWLALNQMPAEFVLLLALGLLMSVLALLKLPANDDKSSSLKQNLDSKSIDNQIDSHDLLMILLLLAIAMRSAVWNIFQLLYAHQYDWLFYLGIAAMVGKIVGGFLADYWGRRNYALFALILAIPLLMFGQHILPFLVLGIFFLQSTTPVAMTAMYQILPHLPATAAGATLGMGIALGGLIFYTGIPQNYLLWYGVPLLGILTLILYNFAIPLKNKWI